MIGLMPLHNKFRITPDDLRSMYVDQKLSVEEISKSTGYIVKTIRVYLIKYGITSNRRGGQLRLDEALNEEALRRLYIDEGKTLKQTADALGCGQTSVFKKLNQLGIRANRATDADRKRRHVRRQISGEEMVTSGYKYVTRADHPLANSNGYVTVHRISAEEYMGQSLATGERVHHINSDRLNNDRDNLAVLPSQTVHAQIHKYVERIGLYCCGLIKEEPSEFKFGQPVFWGGQWITSIDLMKNVRAASARQTGTEKAAEEAPAVTIN